jgi:radical SAM superfamily enzyme YgiQ (UPF0313 family)
VDEVNIGVTGTLLTDLPGVVDACRRVAPKAPVVLGGPAVSLFPREILNLSGADMAVRGEARRPSACWRKLPQPKRSSPRRGSEEGENREIAPAPAGFASSLDSAFRARLAPFYLTESGMLNFQTQRGCPLHCSYCTYPGIEGVRVRRRKVASGSRNCVF